MIELKNNIIAIIVIATIFILGIFFLPKVPLRYGYGMLSTDTILHAIFFIFLEVISYFGYRDGIKYFLKGNIKWEETFNSAIILSVLSAIVVGLPAVFAVSIFIPFLWFIISSAFLFANALILICMRQFSFTGIAKEQSLRLVKRIDIFSAVFFIIGLLGVPGIYHIIIDGGFKF